MRIDLLVLTIYIAIFSGFMRSAGAEPVTKTTSINGIECILRATITTNSSFLQITKSTNNSDTVEILAKLNINKRNSGVVDFSFCSTDRIMWIILKRDTISSKGSALILYPLIYKNNTETFVYQTQNKGRRNSFDLTQLIRQLVISRSRKGNPLSLEKNAKLSNVDIKCLTNNIIEVSCNIGAKYIFTGEIGLINNSQSFFTKNLKISSTDTTNPEIP